MAWRSRGLLARLYDRCASHGTFPDITRTKRVTGEFLVRIRLEVLGIEGQGTSKQLFGAEELACHNFLSQAGVVFSRLQGGRDARPVVLANAEQFVRWVASLTDSQSRLAVTVSKLWDPRSGSADHMWQASVTGHDLRSKVIQDPRKESAISIAWLSLAMSILATDGGLLKRFERHLAGWNESASASATATGNQVGNQGPAITQGSNNGPGMQASAAANTTSDKAANQSMVTVVNMPIDTAMAEIMKAVVAKFEDNIATTAQRQKRSKKYEAGDGEPGKLAREILPAPFIATRSEELSSRLEALERGHDQQSETRAELPMLQYRQDVLDLVNNHPISIIVGDTGSGKTTQVPQILFDALIKKGEGGKCNIICTQPRRIAASSVARRVSEERREPLSESVGFQVRFEDKLCPHPGSINYCTTGILLRNLQSAPDSIINTISHIIVDEVHERSVEIDFLLLLLKLISRRCGAAGKNAPKIVLMSATMDTNRFKNYFGITLEDGTIEQCPTIVVPGRTFPVLARSLEDIVGYEFAQYTHELDFLKDDEAEKNSTEKYLKAELGFAQSCEAARSFIGQLSDAAWMQGVVSPAIFPMPATVSDSIVPHRLVAFTVAHICNTSSSGAVLVFLPGMQAIDTIDDLLRDERPLGLRFNDSSKFRIIKLHSALRERQDDAFKGVPHGCRKILLSTNIAETSITIPEVRFVIDTGKHSISKYDSQTGVSSLNCTWVSKSNALQRKGRAGRVNKGSYYALFSKLRYAAFEATVQPEMLRVDLQQTCLNSRSTSNELSIREFLAATIEPPTISAIETAVSQLIALGALTKAEELTSLGRILLRIPLHPPLAKMSLLSVIFKCLDPILTIGAQLEGEAFFISTKDNRRELDEIRRSLDKGLNSDVLTVMNAYRSARLVRIQRGHHHLGPYLNHTLIKKLTFFTAEKQIDAIENSLAHSKMIKATPFDQRCDGRAGDKSLNTNAEAGELLAALLVAGFTTENIAMAHKNTALRTSKHNFVQMHPSSLNDKKKKEKLRPGSLYCFAELCKKDEGGRLTLRDTTAISPFMALLFCKSLAITRKNMLNMDNWLIFKPTDQDGAPFDPQLVVTFCDIVSKGLTEALGALSDGVIPEHCRFIVDAAHELLLHDATINEIHT